MHRLTVLALLLALSFYLGHTHGYEDASRDVSQYEARVTVLEEQVQAQRMQTDLCFALYWTMARNQVVLMELEANQ